MSLHLYLLSIHHLKQNKDGENNSKEIHVKSMEYFQSRKYLSNWSVTLRYEVQMYFAETTVDQL